MNVFLVGIDEIVTVSKADFYVFYVMLIFRQFYNAF